MTEAMACLDKTIGVMSLLSVVAHQQCLQGNVVDGVLDLF
jgi:hypothetical protein